MKKPAKPKTKSGLVRWEVWCNSSLVAAGEATSFAGATNCALAEMADDSKVSPGGTWKVRIRGGA